MRDSLPPRAIRKRSVTIKGHRTSVSLEQAFWAALREIADQRGLSLAAIIAEVDKANARSAGPSRVGRSGGSLARATNLSSALRVYLLEQLRR